MKFLCGFGQPKQKWFFLMGARIPKRIELGENVSMVNLETLEPLPNARGRPTQTPKVTLKLDQPQLRRHRHFLILLRLSYYHLSQLLPHHSSCTHFPL